MHRVGRPKESQDGDEHATLRAMIVKLAGHGTKMKIMKACRRLRGKNIFTNEDLTKINHEHLLYVKKNCIEGVAVYTSDGIVMARSSITNRTYRIMKKDDLNKFNLFKVAPQEPQNAETAEWLLTVCFYLPQE